MTFPIIEIVAFAPDFSLEAHLGPSPLRLADLRGQIVVLAFYVLDFTST